MTEAPEPRYLDIAARLRQAIENGRYHTGERLPPEPELAKEHGVALMTMRKALNLLKADGTLLGRKGSGNYVQSIPPLRRRGATRLRLTQPDNTMTVLASDDTRSLETDHVTATVQTGAPAPILRALGLSEHDEVLLRTSRYRLTGRPVKYVRTYVPHTLLASTSLLHSDAGDDGIRAALTAAGRAPVLAREEICCRIPTTEECSHLSVPPNRFVIAAYRTSFDADHRPVEIEETVMDSASYVLDYVYEV
ncbi:GntR family transcriptional regulator [Streptomyces gamaensis]|uniref:GntR family transcriptional regulator n=1 Tax=Streptomyces gamaensis TaxID=1763542 RepID=A0ABW0Z9F5_9ACTN